MPHRSPAPRRNGPVPAAVAVTLCLASLTGCASTTYDETLASSATTAISTTTTLPVGTANELLARLRDEAAGLAGVMIDNGDDGAAADRIAALWNAVGPQVRAARPDLYDSFVATVALAQKAVRFSRAADADKASRNFDALVAAFLGS